MPDGPDAQRVAELGRSERRHPQHHGRWYWLVVSLAPVPAVVALAMTARHGWAPVEDPVARYLIAVSLALTVCPIIGAGMSRLGQPRIVGEVIGGIILGPSLFGWLWPQGHAWLFTPRVVSAIGMTAQLGLALFMFLLGCELRTDVVAQHRRAVALVVVGGAGLPFVCGVGLAAALGHPLAGNAAEAVCILFLGLALAITAVPVLARMLVDLGLDRSEVGTVSLVAAAVGDGIAWLGLALILAVTTEATSDNQLVIACLKATALLLVTLLWVRPLLAMLVDRIGPGRYTVLTSVLVGTALGYAAVSQLIGLHVAVGAFLFGVVMPRNSALIGHLDKQLRDFTVTVMLPVFFVSVGLGTSIGLVAMSPGHLGLVAAILLVAVATKIVGAGLGARLAGLTARDALRIGALMNCRGLTELVVASIGYQFGLVNQFGLTALVLTALVTTLSTAPIMRLLDRIWTRRLSDSHQTL